MLSKIFLKKDVKKIYSELYFFSKRYLFLRMQLSSGRLKKTHLIRLCKKKIAKLKMILHKKVNINE